MSVHHVEKRARSTVSGVLLGCYQSARTVLGITPGCCRFEPSCSAYAAEAFERYPLWRAAALSVWRVLRCHPWSRGGYDPVK